MVPDPATDTNWELVHRDGKRDAAQLDTSVASEYAHVQAKESAKAFGKGPDRPITFEAVLAKKDVKKTDKKRKVA